ncbi:hypothetical protein RHS01_05469 [Rhizoctonia solani]|uniref:Uncharacterized protein n=1 Tax=Rhizoctonia solani TaxID=456999 RepID=A0A8H7IEV4_9AGAM|nr:hypothetical protein RHS01_05469 [Rhizoctonia solani]
MPTILSAPTSSVNPGALMVDEPTPEAIQQPNVEPAPDNSVVPGTPVVLLAMHAPEPAPPPLPMNPPLIRSLFGPLQLEQGNEEGV